MVCANNKGLLALSPVIAFLLLYLAASVLIGDFYKIPLSAAFLSASIWAMNITPGKIQDRIDVFSRGAGNSKTLLMVWIFILAGAFSKTASTIGAVDVMVAGTLQIVPPQLLFFGLFLAACLISLSIGTSVGTIVALMPLASGIASSTGTSQAYMAAIIIGGAFFGDNLSFISDTTIASTRAVGCLMSDKFRANIKIVLPAIVIVSAIYIFQGLSLSSFSAPEFSHFPKTIGYLLVIVLSFCKINVSVVLTLGIVVNVILGLVYGNMSITDSLASIGSGIDGMSDLIIITLLAGGMLEVVRHNGGVDYLTAILTRNIKGSRGAQFSIAALVSLANLCTANNTIAIITVGGIASDIAGRFSLDRKKVASILDTFSCFVQGLIPYGAQILMASSICGISPSSVVPYLYYPFLIGLSAAVFIILPESKIKTRSAN